MNIKVTPYEKRHLTKMIEIWNQVVEDGVAFPQVDFLDETAGREFFCRSDLLRRGGGRIRR